MLLTIREWADPILRAPTEPVQQVDSATRKIVDDMIETMLAVGAAGLAANQVGHPLRIMLVDRARTLEAPIVCINPVFTHHSKELVESGEGCFSLPGVFGKVWRPARVALGGLNQQGEYWTWLLTEENWYSIAAQHEHDHLEGVFFTDRAHEIWEDPTAVTATYKGKK